jgi:hypothetical protein
MKYDCDPLLRLSTVSRRPIVLVPDINPRMEPDDDFA